MSGGVALLRARTALRDPVASSVVAGTLVAAAVTGYLAVRHPTLASLLFVVPLALWLLSQRRVALLLLAVTLPYVADVSGGAAGVNMAISDVLMAFLFLGLVFEWVVAGHAFELRALRPMRLVLGQYFAVLCVLLVAHPDLDAVVGTSQRLDLLLLPLVVGALVARTGQELWFLRLMVVGSMLTAAAWLAGIELGQKNPTGQFIANGLILLLAVKPLRRWLIWLVPVMVAGLLWTQSRGAMLSVGVAFAVLLVVQPSARTRARSLLLAVPVAVVSFVAFRLLPEQAQDRNLTFTSADESAGAWAIKIRERYHEDAWTLIHAHPWTGIGVGNYAAGNPYEGTFTDDPHQVLLLEGATGGYLLMASFVVLVVGALLVLARVARGTQVGPVAVALTAAIVGHGLVDVYWVRGTPVAGWLVVGVALGQAVLAGRPAPGEGAPTKRVEPAVVP